MNFGYTVNGLVKGRKITVTIWDRKTCVRLSADEREKLREIIDTFGWNSAQAQGLSRPVTDYNRLKTSDHRLYLICKPHWVRGSRVIGGLKCGKKHLYFRRDDSEGYQECEPMCVLDFYIHERYQRKGLGRRLFKVKHYTRFLFTAFRLFWKTKKRNRALLLTINPLQSS